jgi:hypothetical protein
MAQTSLLIAQDGGTGWRRRWHAFGGGTIIERHNGDDRSIECVPLWKLADWHFFSPKKV